MTRVSRRAILVGMASSTAAVAGCTDTLPGSDDSDGHETLLEQTVTSADGNPATVAFETDAETVLRVECATTEPAIVDIVAADAGQSLATVGNGVVHPDAERIETASVPDTTAELTLVVAMHPDARVELRVTDIGTDASDSESALSITEQVERAVSALEGAETDHARSVIGPLWVHLFDAQSDMQILSSEAVASVQTDVYGRLASEAATEWVETSVNRVADVLTAGSVAAVSAKTGLPGGIIEESLQDEIEQALTSDRVSWSVEETLPRQLDATGGTLDVLTTLSLDLTVQGVGVVVEAPFELAARVAAESVPATASIEDFHVRMDEISVG